jgi:hypothetical protein
MPILAVGGQVRVVADRWLGGLADCCAHGRCGGARRPPNRVDRQIHEEELSTAIYKITQSNPALDGIVSNVKQPSRQKNKLLYISGLQYQSESSEALL